MTDHITAEERDGVLLVTLNRPDKKNALTAEMYDTLAGVLKTLDETAHLRAMVLTGAGDAFTAGNDIEDFLRRPPTDSDAPVMRFLLGLAAMRKPLVGAVNGTGVGIGLTVLLHCDLAYIADHAKLSAPFVKLGIVPEAGSSQLLPALLGHRRAAEILLLGQALDAQAALAAGLVNAVLPRDAVLEQALATAAALAKLPPEAVRLTKGLMRDEPDTLRERMLREGRMFMERLHSDEAREAFSAFLEKRPADFSKFA